MIFALLPIKLTSRSPAQACDLSQQCPAVKAHALGFHKSHWKISADFLFRRNGDIWFMVFWVLSKSHENYEVQNYCIVRNKKHISRKHSLSVLHSRCVCCDPINSCAWRSRFWNLGDFGISWTVLMLSDQDKRLGSKTNGYKTLHMPCNTFLLSVDTFDWFFMKLGVWSCGWWWCAGVKLRWKSCSKPSEPPSGGRFNRLNRRALMRVCSTQNIRLTRLLSWLQFEIFEKNPIMLFWRTV